MHRYLGSQHGGRVLRCAARRRETVIEKPAASPASSVMVESASSEEIWVRRILEGAFLWLVGRECRMGSMEVLGQLVLIREALVGSQMCVSNQSVSRPISKNQSGIAVDILALRGTYS